MLTDNDENGDFRYLELNCSRHQLKAASISHSVDGTYLRCSCGPLSEADVGAAERAAHDGTQVWLVFPDSEVILSDVSVEVAQAGWLHLVGKVVTIPKPTEWRGTQHPPAGS